MTPGSKEQATQCRLGVRPRDDRGYFEQMSKVIFRSGLRWDLIEKKWPAFRKALADFSIEKVAGFGEEDLERLLRNPDIVRNYRKLKATVDNARAFLDLRREHGSFGKYLRQLSRGGEEEMCKALSKRFSFLGGSTVVFFLRSVGEEMPETLRRWSESR
jgi:DNA-3-methyladenine glycosylase I